MKKAVFISLLASAVMIITAVACKKSGTGLSNDPSDKHVDYSGPHKEDVGKLLSAVKGWRTNSSLTTNDGIPPEVPVSCIRDTYVAAAVSYAWAAEAYYRLGYTDKAEEMAGLMDENLYTVKQLCSNGPVVGGGSCDTEEIYPCP